MTRKISLAHPAITTQSLSAIVFIAMAITSVASVAQPISMEEALLIDEGFDIFMEETFEGNGRTCGTCHVPSQQYTISPDFISTLSGGDLALVFASVVPGLENPTLVEQFGLFNTGGGDALAPAGGADSPIFRASQQITALNVTTINFFGLADADGRGSHRLGWAGNGSPSGGFHHGNDDLNADGTVRAFANGAIAQHFTRRLDRVAKSTACDVDINDPGADCLEAYDFRFASDQELDALEAFQRWLGRRPAPATPSCGVGVGGPLCTPEYIAAMPPGGKGEFTLVPFDANVLQTGPTEHELVFSNKVVEEGKAIFQSDEASCFLCHQNGGAHFGNNGRPHGNLERNQGIEFFTAGLSEESGVLIPQDPGNGATTGAQPRAMNVQTIIEAARRRHFGHNNAIVGFETMVGEGFHKPFVRDLDPELGCDGIGIVGTGAPGREGLVGSSNDNHADSEECLDEAHGPDAVNRMAGFLRVLSAWYALRDIERFVAETCDRIDLGVSTDLPVMEAGFSLEDVQYVLSGSKVKPLPHNDAINEVKKLEQRLLKAASRQNKQQLGQIYKKVQKIRDKIATTNQEGPRPIVCT
jgi:hypothetical protein